MANISRSSGSLETLEARVTAGGHDPTSDLVQVGVSTSTDVATVPGFHPASWATASGVHYVRFQVGPGSGIGQLAKGVFYVFVRVTDAPDVPELLAEGTLRIF